MARAPNSTPSRPPARAAPTSPSCSASPPPRRGCGPSDAAHAAAYESVSGPAAAAVRLLGLDPFHATAVLARLAPDIDAVARRCRGRRDQRACTEGSGALPAASAPLLDIAAEAHAAWPVRLFAS